MLARPTPPFQLRTALLTTAGRRERDSIAAIDLSLRDELVVVLAH
jgi:hypothetical protein